jgi:hypothetical protein
MERNLVLSVSDVTKVFPRGEYYCCGFTITYSNGKIRNFILKSKLANDHLMLKALEKKRLTFLEKIPLGKQEYEQR